MTDHQLTATDLAALSPEKVEQARVDGRLDDLLGITRHRPPAGQWTQADVEQMFREKRFDAIADARAAGQLNDMLAGKTEEDE